MKKGNKGFTLIELLATIVILGIIFMFAAPAITGMVGSNRDKMYVTDVQKLMAQAEYKMKAANTDIEKPSDGNCIVISLVYLDDSDFDTAPNRGEYVKEASYVVVKNDGGRLEYSGAIVEKMPKGGYKGIELTSSSKLHERNAASKYVKGINYIVKVTDDSHFDNSTYINGRLGGQYVDSIEKVYNEPKLDDDASSGGLEPPVITKATLTSTSGKPFNSLDATLTLTVEDEDSPGSSLKVYISTTSYSDALCATCTGESYGINNSFTKKFNFDQKPYNFNYENNSIVNLFIVVRDKEKNEDRTNIVYRLHENGAPTVVKEESGFSKQVGDKVNRPTAVFRLSVSDDIDDYRNLEVCFNENTSEETCKDYKPYRDLFEEDNEMLYSFESNECVMNGQTKNVRVFVRDTKGLINKENVFSYTIAKNNPPVIDSVTITSEKEAFMDNSVTSGSLNIRVKTVGSDDVSTNSKIKVEIKEPNSTTKKLDMLDTSAETPFTINGQYDGQNRNITVRLTDECGVYKDVTKAYKVYQNKPPVLSNINVESNGFACNDEEQCPLSSGGNQKATVSFAVDDDLDYDDIERKIKVCMSENKADCRPENTANFEPFSNYVSGHEYVFNKNKTTAPYDGTTKTLYIIAKDSNGSTNYDATTGNKVTYKLYKNKAPAVTNYEVKSESKSYTVTGSLDTRIFFNVKDDIDKVDDLRYKVKILSESGAVEYQDNTFKKVENNESGIEYRIPGKHDGKTKKIVLEVYDTYNEATKNLEATYKLYANQPPTIFAMGTPAAEVDDQPFEFDEAHEDDRNENNIPDADEKFTVKYMKGEHGDFIEGEEGKTLFRGCSLDTTTPEFAGDKSIYVEKQDEPEPETGEDGEGTSEEPTVPVEPQVFEKPKAQQGWVFTRWKPYLSDTIQAEMATRTNCGSVNATDTNQCEIVYVAEYKEDVDGNGIPDEEEVRTGYFKITPKTGNCHANYTCPYLNSGNPNVTVDFDIEDDIDSEDPDLDDLLICLTEDASKCERKQVCTSTKTSAKEYVHDCILDGKYFRYSKFTEAEKTFEFNIGKSINNVYDGSKHTLYVYAMDSEESTTRVSQEYTVYKNEAPTIVEDSISVESTVAPYEEKNEAGEVISTTYYNSKNVKYKVDATDDYELPLNLQVQVCYRAKSSSANSAIACTNYMDYTYDHEYPITLDSASYARSANHDFVIYARIKDSLGKVTSTDQSKYLAAQTYKLYTDTAPVIKSAVATYQGGLEIDMNDEGEGEGTDIPEPTPSTDPSEDTGTYTVKYVTGNTGNRRYGNFTENVEGKTLFSNLSAGDSTPPYAGETTEYSGGLNLPSSRDNNYVFSYWNPVVEEYVSGTNANSQNVITYTAVWGRDINHNGLVDDEEENFTEPEGVTQAVGSSPDKPKIIVSVDVDDKFDTYKICVAQENNKSKCTGKFVGKANGEGFSADDVTSGMVYYVKDKNEYLQYFVDEEGVGTTYTEYYVFVQDSYGNISEGTPVLGHTVNDCAEIEEDESAGSFTFLNKQVPTTDGTGITGTKISASTCSNGTVAGLCYYAQASEVTDPNDKDALKSERVYDTSGIVGLYTQKLKYQDRFKPEKLCPKKITTQDANGNDITVEETSEVTKNCSFIDCFKYPEVSGQPVRYMMAIGLRKRTMPRTESIPVTDLLTSTTYDGQDYYAVYSVTYDGYSGNPTITPTGKKIPVSEMEAANSPYIYNPSNTVNYVRIRD